MPAGPVGSCWAAGSWEDTAWEANPWFNAGAAVGNAILDLNTRLHRFLNEFYGTSSDKDVTTLMTKYLNEELTGDYNVRVRQLIDDATA
jgi:hypothetical protein